MLRLPSILSVFSSLKPRVALLPALLAGLLLPAAAQVSYTGNTTSENFGSVAIGSPATAAFPFTVQAGTTIGSIGVLTQGSPNLDFTDASTSTCTATTYNSDTNCTLNVTFTPRAAGLRIGAVVFFIDFDRTGGQLVNVPIYGTGLGPQIAYGPAVATAIAPTVAYRPMNTPEGVALNGAGDLFIADYEGNRILDVPASGGVATAIDPDSGSDIPAPWSLTVDGAGDLFAGLTYNSSSGNEFDQSLEEFPAGGGPAITVYSGVDATGIAMDPASDLFLSSNNFYGVEELPAGGDTPTNISPSVNGKQLYQAGGVAIDQAGDLYIADSENNRVLEVPAGGAPAVAIEPTVSGKPLNDPSGLAVDGLGNLFIADAGNARIVEIPADGGSPTAISPTVNGEALGDPYAVAVDGGGDLFIPDPTNNRVVKVARSQSPTINFPTITPLNETDTTDGTKTVQIFNIGNQPLTFSAVSYPEDFPEATGDANACTASTSLSAGQECDLPIEFAPQNQGAPLIEDVTLTSNALNANGGQQSIAVTGTTPAPDTLYYPVQGSTLSGPEATFIWAPASGAAEYSLWIGSTGVGSSNLYDSGARTATSYAVAGLPTNGGTIYVRLNTITGKTSIHSDYTLTAGSQAVMLSPTPNTSLTGSSVTFSWSAVPKVGGYSLWIGSTGTGSYNVYNSHETTATSVTASHLPTNGEMLYVRLYTIFTNGVSVSKDYVYTAQ